MSPNPMVAVAAPAPDSRYAPREMPRFGGRSEGRAFEQRLSMAEAESRPGSASKGAAQAKPPEKPADAKDASSEAAAPVEAKTEGQAVKPSEASEPNAAASSPAASAPVSELASVAVMTGAAPEAPASQASASQAPAMQPPAPQAAGMTPAPTPEAAATANQAAEEAVVQDPALAAAVVKAIGKQDAETKTKAEEASQDEAPEAAKAAVSVKPLARQGVPSSLDGLHAVKGLTSLKESLDGAPRTETKPEPARVAAQAVPAHLDEVRATVIEPSDAPEALAVKPWEIAEPVRVSPEGGASRAEAATMKAEPVPVKEAITRTFMQVQRSPDRPAELRLQLNPEHLGRMEVRVHAHEGVVSAIIRVEHGAVRDLVESQFAALRASLAEQGIKVDRLEVSVNQQGPRDQQAAAGFDLGRQSFGQDAQQDPSGQSQQGASQQTGWEAWSLDEPEDMPTEEAIALSGFDAQA